jgi:hypothetical protein
MNVQAIYVSRLEFPEYGDWLELCAASPQHLVLRVSQRATLANDAAVHPKEKP